VDFRRAFLGIRCVDRDAMLVDVILVHVVEMAIVQIIHMAVMANCSVPATRPMLVSVVGVMFLGARGHRHVPCQRSVVDDPHQRRQPWNCCEAIDARPQAD
jgi:hypothetical protein